MVASPSVTGDRDRPAPGRTPETPSLDHPPTAASPPQERDLARFSCDPVTFETQTRLTALGGPENGWTILLGHPGPALSTFRTRSPTISGRIFSDPGWDSDPPRHPKLLRGNAGIRNVADPPHLPPLVSAGKWSWPQDH